MSTYNDSLISGRVLVRNTAWNVVGIGVPLAIGLFAMPFLIKALGTERFGLLTLIWVGVGYLSLFDMGIGRALTKLVAEHLGREDTVNLRPLIWTAFAAIGVLGVAAALIAVPAATYLVRNLLKVSEQLQTEGVLAFQILGAALPFVILNTALVGILEAHQRFRAIAVVRVPLGAMTFGVPLLIALVTPNLAWLTVALVLVRLLALVAYSFQVVSVRPDVVRPIRPSRRYLRELLQLGGWLTVSNLVGPLMVYFDRFAIGALVTMTAVAHYTTPFEVLIRIELIPVAIMGVVFPALSTASVVDAKRLVAMYRNSVFMLMSIATPLLAAAFLFAPEALRLWIDEAFSTAGSPVARWLAAGMVINFAAQAAFTALQALGRPASVAKTHLAEIVPYFLVLWVLTTNYGIVGAAIAWFLRVLVDCVALNELTRRHIPSLGSSVNITYMLVMFALAFLGIGFLIDPIVGRALLLAILVAGSLIVFTRTLRTVLNSPAASALPTEATR